MILLAYEPTISVILVFKYFQLAWFSLALCAIGATGHLVFLNEDGKETKVVFSVGKMKALITLFSSVNLKDFFARWIKKFQKPNKKFVVVGVSALFGLSRSVEMM
ncbi:hypothetical protein VPH35_068636 [Triticum aestivum]|uniref:Uncharacterized protein n=1 Tax=Triticum turgidum subsp. durum TaxID=4567 RepID=A0A9R0SLU9_TRITD|nr:unnamed protein product [Triticum turgidum subsp. durum]